MALEDFDLIVRQHQRRVYRVIFLLVKDADAADSLTQETFLRAYRELAGFRGECRFDTWLLRIAVNLARDHGKNRRVWFWKRLVGLDAEDSAPVRETVAASDPTPEELVLMREELDAVWATLASLSPRQRTVFLLRFVEEMSLAEIGQVLGIREGTVKAQLFRALRSVRERVKPR